MIDSLDQHVDEIEALAKRTKASTGYIVGSSSSYDEELQEKTNCFIRGNSMFAYYLRMSWRRKMQFMNDLVHRIRSLGTITLLLNTLHSVTGKITSYSVTSPVPPIIFDKVLSNHDRMLDPDILEETIAADMHWFQSLNDRQQVAYLISLIRFSAGAVIRILYDRLQDTYNERICALTAERSPAPPPTTPYLEKATPPSQMEYDLDDPKHMKVLALEKLWNQEMDKMRKDIAQRMPKPQNDNPEKKKRGGRKGSKKKGKKDDDRLDWVQLMPIWIVKRIFGYLDKKTLNKAKTVNAYWKWAIGELAKDRKMRKALDKANKKLKKDTGGDCILPDDAMLEKPKRRISHTERRVRRLEQRGAILETMRHCGAKTTDCFSVLVEAWKASSFVSYDDCVQMYPRVARTNPPLYKRPEYLVKDLNLIYETRDDLSDSGYDLTSALHHGSESTLGSDEDVFCGVTSVM